MLISAQTVTYITVAPNQPLCTLILSVIITECFTVTFALVYSPPYSICNKIKPPRWSKSNKAIKQKQELFLAYKKSVDFITHKTLRNIIKALIKKSHANYEAKNTKSAPKI